MSSDHEHHPSFSSLFKTSPVLTDGGLGTTLEDDFCIDISHTPLWSAKAVIEQPEAILQAHLAFLNAGSDIISTSTYQCSFTSFNRAGLSETDACVVMRKAVDLARQARDAQASDESDRGKMPKKKAVVLSLGPFGACLSPAQEFDGFYPPPFGPRGYSANGENINSFDEDKAAEDAAVEALVEFHFDRLIVFLEDEKTWEAIDCLAFETVPLCREVRAIRIAMGRLGKEITQRKSVEKPWWISLVFPEGKFPEKSSGGLHVDVGEVALVTLTGQDTPRPSALGINCTAIEDIPAILRRMSEALRDHVSSAASAPWLVLYPNGGDIYDPITQTWKSPEGEGTKGEKWANYLRKIVEDVALTHKWGGYIVGGCCRTGPSEIALLRKAVNSEMA